MFDSLTQQEMKKKILWEEKGKSQCSETDELGRVSKWSFVFIGIQGVEIHLPQCFAANKTCFPAGTGVRSHWRYGLRQMEADSYCMCQVT